MEENTKTRYSDEELEEFRTIINEMLEKARAEYATLREIVTHAGGNDILDTAPTFKTVEDDGAFQLSKEEASEVEKMYIALYRSHEIKHGYNLTEGGETGIVHTMESRRKLSASKMGKRYNIGVPFTEERKRHLSENHADVSGEKNPMYGKKWTPEEIAIRQSHRTYTRGGEHPSARPILQLDMNGNLIKRWGSITEAAEVYCRTSIKDCLRGKYKQHRGYQWRYADEN